MDLSLEVIFLLATLLLAFALLQELLKHFYHRDHVVKLQRIVNRQRDSSTEMVQEGVDPYYLMSDINQTML